MDFISTLKTELFRPFTTVIVPGSIAVSPYIILINHLHNVEVCAFWHDSKAAFAVIIIISIVMAGLLLENIGSIIELVLRKLVSRTKGYENIEDEWNDYLGLKLKDEIVGQRYLRTIHLRMKFELSMIPSIALFLLGFYLLKARDLYNIKQGEYDVVFWIGIALAVYLILESYLSTRLLARTRRLILNAMNPYHKLW